MSGLLFIVNKKLSPKTDRYWKKNQPAISAYFPNSDVCIPESLDTPLDVDIGDFEIVVFVGDDLFFSGMVNNLYQTISEIQVDTSLAFLPDSGSCSLSHGLGWPGQLKKQLELIQSKQSIPLDIIRSHFINNEGFPSSRLVLNDILIGAPKIQYPLVFKNISHWMTLLAMLFTGKKAKQIELISQKTTVFEGSYIFSLVMLGNKITNGPKISTRHRINLAKFEYYQFNKRPLIHLPAIIPGLLSTKTDGRNGDFIREKFSELEIKGTGNDNAIIIDGVQLGRLPATFLLLPKAMNVISPLITVRVMKSWKSRISSKIAKPVGNSMFTDLNRLEVPPRNPFNIHENEC